MAAVQVNAAWLKYVEQGNGSPVVFVHGGASDHRTWHKQLTASADSFRGISYSRRYHWPNEKIAAGASYAMAEQVEAGVLRSGKIKFWRDYFDLGTYQRAVARLDAGRPNEHAPGPLPGRHLDRLPLDGKGREAPAGVVLGSAAHRPIREPSRAGPSGPAAAQGPRRRGKDNGGEPTPGRSRRDPRDRAGGLYPHRAA